MPQTFQVLRCYKCLIFQIHQTKKSNKWQCKVCGEKQSIKRHYGIGTGKDCRMHVQKLNKMQGENVKNPDLQSDCESSDNEECTPEIKTFNTSKKSKWSNYIDTSNKSIESDETMYLNDQEVVLEMPKKTKSRKRKSQSYVEYEHNLTDKTFDDCNTYVLSKNHEVDNDIEINTIPSQNYPLGIKSQVWKPPFNNQKYKDDLKTSDDSSIENIPVDNFYSQNISSNIQQPKQSHTIIKNSSKQNVKKSKWDEYIENEEQNTLNSSCETNASTSNVVSHSTSVPIFRAIDTESYSNMISPEESSPIPPNIARSTNKGCTSLFSMSNDCDLDNILNY